MNKNAETDHPIHNTLAVRWSPYVFSAKPVATADLAALFEAARWAPSSYNAQPWRYIVGRKAAGSTHQRILQCLSEGNQSWAANAPVLALGVVMHPFESSGKANKAAIHDLGLASANLVIEATTRRLYVHQMIGLDPEAARTEFSIPAEAEAYTALAIGYRESEHHTNEALRQREAKPRTRKPLSALVFSERFGESADF